MSTPNAAPPEPRRALEPAVLLTVPQAAHLLGIKRTKLYELLASGDLPSVRIGSCRRIHRSSLEDYVQRLLDAI